MKRRRKLIIGQPHVQVPCTGCGSLIWVPVKHNFIPTLPACTDCEPDISGIYRRQQIADRARRITTVIK